jgi:tRNA dihydrouridine synthase A
MEKVDDLLPNIHQALHKRLDGEELEHNLILQLGSNDAIKLGDCVRIASELYPNLKEINLSCGCPSIDTGGASTYGASLMKDSTLTAKLVESMVSASDIDVSVKCRIGVFHTAEDVVAMNDKQYEYLHNYISSIHRSGAKHVILHARPAILSLSPVKNRIVPQLDYEIVQQIAHDFDGKLKITLNGGINSLDELKAIQANDNSKISSYMSGRWCLRRPLDLASVETTLSDNSSVPDVKTAVEQYIDYALVNQNRFTMSELCLPLYLVVSQLQQDYENEVDDGLLSWRDIETLYDTIEDGLAMHLSTGKVKKSPSINFKKLATSFGPLCGKKVVSKWKRNRSEL